MKLSIHIMAIYLFALSLIPCGDGGGVVVETIHHFTALEYPVASHPDRHSNNCNDDFCSPLCVCNCCSITLDSSIDLPCLLKQHLPLFSDQPFYIHHFTTVSYNAAIWQPPQFC